MAKTRTVKSSVINSIVNPTMTTTNYTNPLDIIEDKLLACSELYASVTNSLAWMVDTSVLNQARNVLFERYAEQEGEAFDEFLVSVGQELQHESLYENEGSEQTLAQLLSLRMKWHDVAQSAAFANNRDYSPSSLREQLESEKPMSLSGGALKNFQALAKAEAMGDMEKEERLLKLYQESHTIAEAERIRKGKALRSPLLEIIRSANAYALETYDFEALPRSRQKQLTTFAKSTIERTLPQLATRLAKQPIEFGRTMEAGREALKCLDKMLVEKFSDAGEMENIRSQTEINMGRNAKRVACSID
jgi:hypothetical protein